MVVSGCFPVLLSGLGVRASKMKKHDVSTLPLCLSFLRFGARPPCVLFLVIFEKKPEILHVREQVHSALFFFLFFIFSSVFIGIF